MLKPNQLDLSAGTLIISLMIFLMIAATLASAQPCRAELSTGQIKAVIDKARVIPRQATYSVRNDRGNILVEVKGYPSSNPRDRRIDAILIARTLINADPGNITSVVTRYLDDASGNAFTEAVVSNIEIEGAAAGAMNGEELLNGVMLINIGAGDSVETRCSKYIDAALKETDQGGLSEAEELFARARTIMPEAAARCEGFGRGMIKLASAYKYRGDNENVDRIYDSLLQSLTSAAAPGTAGMATMREVGKFYRDRKDFKNAEAISEKLIACQVNNHSPEYPDDLLNLAVCRRNLKDTAKAMTELEQVLRIHKEAKEPDHKAMAAVLEEMGDCSADAGDSRKAVELYKEARTIYDTAAAAKGPSGRIPYEIYHSVTSRLNTKISTASSASQ
ncbi:MAG: tetratricopeptide repeat protein [Candidatus Melainabacteria bacterium]|nr:tetratricopeptide repeat protein [Candidatus Melainabacteria bacterium]